MNPIETLTDEALLLKLRGAEHDFVERKPRGQKGDWLQVAVAFANSAPIGWPAVLFIGVDDMGTPQQGPEKLEDLEKSIAGIIEQAYPPIYFDIRPIHIGETACLAVVIPGSANRPHFAGKSYVRKGPETREASDGQFAELIASRNGKAREIAQWIGKTVSWVNLTGEHEAIVLECNAHYVAFRIPPTSPVPSSHPLAWLELGFDYGAHRLQIRADRL